MRAEPMVCWHRASAAAAAQSQHGVLAIGSDQSLDGFWRIPSHNSRCDYSSPAAKSRDSLLANPSSQSQRGFGPNPTHMTRPCDPKTFPYLYRRPHREREVARSAKEARLSCHRSIRPQ